MKKLIINNQIEVVHEFVKKINSKKIKPITNCVMSGIAMFSLKYPSLLKFNDSREDSQISHNLKTLYKVEKAPSDTYMREELDEVEPDKLRGIFTSLFKLLQVTKKLKAFLYLGNSFLLSIDGTQYFASKKINCKDCCETTHKNGTTTYSHKMIGASIVSPEMKEVIPVCPEQIIKQDGETKNDCELAAVVRFLYNFKREHPHIKVTVLEDALYATAPHIQLLRELNFDYIIRVKSTGSKHLFDQVKNSDDTQIFKKQEGDSLFRYRFLNSVSLNKSNLDEKVNFIECIEIKDNGRESYFTFITSIPITENNAYKIMRSGRARWKIENETFNTLKNQGYHFEHNFGHGKKNLSVVFSLLMLVAFLMDQIQSIGSLQFKKAIAKVKSKTSLWFEMRSLFTRFLILSWDDLFLSIAHSHQEIVLAPNSS